MVDLSVLPAPGASDSRTTFLIFDALVQYDPDQTTEPMGNRSDGLSMPEPWKEPPIHRSGNRRDFRPWTGVFWRFVLALVVFGAIVVGGDDLLNVFPYMRSEK